MKEFLPGLLHGPLPTMKDLEAMKGEADLLWNLTAEFASVASIERRYVPEVLVANIPDSGVPELPAFREQLAYVVDKWWDGKRVFVHCFGGKGRTGMVLAAIHMVVVGDGFETALAQARTATGGPETDEQVEFLRLLEKEFKS
jgi:protein-tyrosine phosphatase